MGYNNEYADIRSPLILDLETAGLPNAEEYLEPVEADKRLRDPVKVSEDIAAKLQARIERLALDWNVGRIVGLGWWTDTMNSISVCPSEDLERRAITDFWDVSRHRTIVGFAIKGFDLRFLIQRSRYLGINYPQLDLGKYSRKGIIDLYLDLTFNDGTYDQGCMRRTLHAFCRRFGIAVHDEISGKDIPALVKAGDWLQVESHLRSDLDLTVALARKLGVVTNQPEMVA